MKLFRSTLKEHKGGSTSECIHVFYYTNELKKKTHKQEHLNRSQQKKAFHDVYLLMILKTLHTYLKGNSIIKDKQATISEEQIPHKWRNDKC
jgi:hypothetical protein